MIRYLFVLAFACLFVFKLSGQRSVKKSSGYPNTIAPVGIIKNISDSALLDIDQRQTFRYFWNFGHSSHRALDRFNSNQAGTSHRLHILFDREEC